MSNTALIAGFAASAAVIARGTLRHRTFFEQTQTELVIKGLDPRHDGLRVAQLSDIHIGISTPAARIRAAVAAVNAAEVDFDAADSAHLPSAQWPHRAGVRRARQS
jgi:hypothetical protein